MAEVYRREDGAGVSVAIISDPGEDLDDEMACLLLRRLVDEGLLVARCVVCNLYPSKARARLMRGTLDTLGLGHVPVGFGSDGGDTVHQRHDTFSSADYVAASSRALPEGQSLLRETFEASAPSSLTLLCISALTDAAAFVEARPQLFAAKIREVVIMGGVTVGDRGRLVADDAANNVFDKPAAGRLYEAVQRLRVPMVVVTREAAYACPVPRAVYDDIAATGSPIGARLQVAQRSSITRLWRRSHATGAAERANLPPRCDPRWFADTFCGGLGADRGPDDDVWDLVQSFNMYDVIALVACAPALRATYFDPRIVTVDGVQHAIIGYDKHATGVRDAPGLRAFLTDGFLRGITSKCLSPAGSIPLGTFLGS